MSIKRIDIAEFRELGLLQEVNRQFLHPLGLALEVEIEDDGSMRLGGIWDYRDDPEGVAFAVGLSAEAAALVDEMRAVHTEARHALFGAPVIVQPLDWVWAPDASSSGTSR